jgi:uncharacterized integral membrane protein
MAPDTSEKLYGLNYGACQLLLRGNDEGGLRDDALEARIAPKSPACGILRDTTVIEDQQPTSDTTPDATKEQKARNIAIGILVLIVVLFALLNSQTVKIKWLVTSTRMPLIVAIVLSAAVGFAVGWLLARRNSGSRQS